MVVQHNMQAMNSSRMLGITTSAQGKVTEKLSSGYRINRAADDAAGLSISEKMRKQMRGLDRASTNAQDGVSAVQTAEGALNEVHSMLQRMNELAVQAANGTNSKTDRDALQAEIEQLTTEIDRVSETTKFNETYLLKGDANGATGTRTINAHDAGLKGELTNVGTGSATFTAKALNAGDKVTIGGVEYEIAKNTKSVTDAQAAVDGLTPANGDKLTYNGTEYTYNGTSTKWEDAVGNAADLTAIAEGDKIKIGDGEEFTVANPVAGSRKLEIVKGAFGDYGHLTGGTAANATSSNADVTVAGTYTGAADATLTYKDGTGGETAGWYLGTNTTNTPDATAGTAYNGITLTENNTPTAGDTITLTAATAGTTYTAFASEDEMKAALEAGETIYKGDNATTATEGTDYTFKEGGKKISKAEAYDKMQKELEAASNIGTDDDTKATVVNNNNGTFTITEGKAAITDSLTFNLHVGSDADMTNKINVEIEAMSAANLGIKGLQVSDKTGTSATYAIDAIADALQKVSEQRSALGAVQNRLEHTIANLDNVVENTTASESRIRDVDMADAMVEYSKNNILAQAGQSMLAQANQANQGVLSLLQ